MSMEVLALDPDKAVRWRCKAGPEEWIGTDLDFRLAREGDYTIGPRPATSRSTTGIRKAQSFSMRTLADASPAN